MTANLLTPGVRANPYVGPQSFRRGDQIYGRDREAADLLDLLVAERIVLLHSPSGAGKTSLIHARLVPLLEEEGFEVLPVVRVNRPLPEAPEGGQPAGNNRYVLSTLLSLEEGLPHEAQHSVEQLGRMTLARYLAQRPDLDGRPGNEVIVFDQFEEVITADPVDREAKAAFFADLGTMLGDKGLWAIFAIREDFIAELDPFVRVIPTRLSTRYRLDLLTAAEALDAMTLPARDAGVEFDTEAARQLVDDLRAIRVQRGTTVTQELGPYVEPVQLQVVCRLLWDRLPTDAQRVRLADVQAIGDVDQALAAYYADCVSATSSATAVPERLLRDWFEKGLITPQGFRGQVMRGPDSPGVSGQTVLTLLTDRHLLRSESRRGAVWYELAHDRLVEPIQKDNATWREGHLSRFERRARLWELESRSDHLLLSGPELAEARAAIQSRPEPLTDIESAFLDASGKSLIQAERMTRANARTKRWLVATVIVCVLALAAAGLAISSTVGANRAANNALQAAIVGQGFAELGRDTQLGLLLAEQAARIGAPSGTTAAAADETLLQRAVNVTPVIRVLRGPSTHAMAAAYSADGTRIAAVHKDGSVYVWEAVSGALQTSHAGIGAAHLVALSPDGLAVAVATADGRLAIWDTRTKDRFLADRRYPDAVVAMAFSPDGRRLAYTAGDTARVMDVETGRDERVFDSEWSLIDIAWRPDGTAVIGLDLFGSLQVWGDSAAPSVPAPAVAGLARALDVSPDGSMVASGWGTGEIAIHKTGVKQPKVYEVASTGVLDLAFTADGRRLMVLDEYGNIWATDPLTGETAQYSYEPGTWPLVIDADPKHADRLLVATGEGNAAIWNVTQGHNEAPTAIDTALDGTVLTGSADGTGRLWSVDSGQRGVVGAVDTSWPSARPDRVGSAKPVVASDTGLVDAVIDRRNRFVVTLDARGAVTITGTQRGSSRPQLAAGDEVTFASVALSPSGTYVATGDAEQPFDVRIWEVSTGRLVKALPGHTDEVTKIAFGTDDDLVSVSVDKSTRVWRRTGGASRLSLDPLAAYNRATTSGVAEDEAISLVAWAASEGQPSPIATAVGSSVQLWNPETGQLLRELHGHTGFVTDMAFDRDGKRLLTTGVDHTAVVWDVASGGAVKRIQQSDRVMAGAFVGTGDRLVLLTRTETGPLVVWMNRNELVATAADRTTRTFSATECERYQEFFTGERRCPT